MKHTFWYIDQLLQVLNVITIAGDYEDHKGGLRTESEKKQARAMLDKIIYYDKKLRKLIDAHKTEEHLRTLHKCHIDSIPFWVERVNTQFRKLDALLKVLEEDIPKLERVLESEPNMWTSRIQDMNLGFIRAGFYDAENNMEEFRKAAVFERKHLQEIIGDVEELEKVLE